MKRMMQFVMVPFALVAILFATAGRVAADDIVDIAASNPDFSTLVTAVKAAGLVDALKGEGPFTVFAPTNAAFKKLEKKIGKHKFNAILKDKKKLTAILTYHVVKGKVLAEDVVKLKSGTQVATLQGGKVKVTLRKQGVMINNAKVIKTDIEADNGVIHVIDAVLLPK